MKDIYVVTAYRFGDRNSHSYVLGVFEKKAAAIKCADSHTAYRGGKYICVVDSCKLNHFNDKDDNYSTEVYSAPNPNEPPF